MIAYQAQGLDKSNNTVWSNNCKKKEIKREKFSKWARLKFSLTHQCSKIHEVLFKILYVYVNILQPIDDKIMDNHIHNLTTYICLLLIKKFKETVIL